MEGTMENVKGVFSYADSLAEQTEKSLKDGFQARDLMDYVDELFNTPAFVGNLPGAAEKLGKGLSDDEREELKVFVKGDLDLEDDFLEAKIEATNDMIVAIDKWVRIIRTKRPIA